MSNRQDILDELRRLLAELDARNEALAAIRIAEAIELLNSDHPENEGDQK
ncbi:hypothetical protein [Parasphingorhabdus sp.]